MYVDLAKWETLLDRTERLREAMRGFRRHLEQKHPELLTEYEFPPAPPAVPPVTSR